MAEPLLRVQSLSKTFGRLRVLDEVSFDLQPGEIVGVVGRRGAGKSVLLELIAGALPPSSGEIILEGRRFTAAGVRVARQQGIELVYETPQIVEQLGVVENIFLGHEVCWPARIGVPTWEKMYDRCRDLLADFDMPLGLLGEQTKNLTDEQRQVVALARAFCNPPRLLLVDDILDRLSFQRQQIVLERIRELARAQAGVIICGENLKHLFNITNRILVLYEGRLTAERRTDACTPREIVELIVGATNREQVTPVIWALENYHAAQRHTEELFHMQTVLHKSLEASDSLNRQLVERLSEQVKAMDQLNTALQETQRRLMTDREEERKALARELHDSAIQDLLSLNYRLEEAEDEGISQEARDQLSAIRNGVRQVVGDLRQLCRDLRPPTIDNHGLSAAINSLVQEWSERSGLKVHIVIDPAFGRLPEAIELSVFRIVQEGINNVSKHASAKKMHLTLERTMMDGLLLRIEDDGKGAVLPPDLSNLSLNKHFGLVGISERAALLGGSMKIETSPRGGLVLQVEIPSPYPSG